MSNLTPDQIRQGRTAAIADMAQRGLSEAYIHEQLVMFDYMLAQSNHPELFKRLRFLSIRRKEALDVRRCVDAAKIAAGDAAHYNEQRAAFADEWLAIGCGMETLPGEI